MKRLPHPTPARLLLLALVALLLFGNCGGGVRGFLSMGAERRNRLRAIIVQERAQRAATRQQLRGRARRDELYRLEHATNARLDSLLPSQQEQRKLQHRRNKIERQLFRNPA